MGNYITKTYTINDIDKIINNHLEKLDINKDGYISKKEFDEWKNKEINNIKQEYNNNYENINKELLTLKQINKDLEQKLIDKNKLIEKLGENIKTDEDVNELVKLLSIEQINKYVEDILNNEQTNIPYFPDVVEREIYRNIFKILLKIMNKILGSMSFELIGHKLSIKMIPHSL